MSSRTFERCEIGARVAAEAALGTARLMPIGETGAQFAPVREAVRPEFRLGVGMLAGHDGSNEPHGAAHHHGGVCALAAGGPPGMVASAAELVLQVIVGAGRPGHVVAVE